MKKIFILFGLVLLFSMSLVSAIDVDIIWHDRISSSQNRVFEQGEVLSFDAEAFTTGTYSNGYGNEVTLNVNLISTLDVNTPIDFVVNEKGTKSIVAMENYDSSNLAIGDYYLSAIAQDLDDPRENGDPRYVTKKLYFSIKEPYVKPNNVPVMQEVIINPSSPSFDDDLKGACKATDADGDNLVYEYQWLQDDFPFSDVKVTSEYPSGSFVRVENILAHQTNHGDSWNLTCRAFDGKDYSEPLSFLVKIPEQVQNIPPVTTGALINPTKPTVNNDLIGFCSATDEDDTAVMFNYVWYKNDVKFDSGESTYLDVRSNKHAVDQLSSDDTSAKDEFILSCQSFDGEDAGEWINSTAVTIKDIAPQNVAPIMVSNVITPKNPVATDDLVGYCLATDEDTAFVYYVVTWYVNGVEVQNKTSKAVREGVKYSSILSSDNFVAGDVVKQSCIAFDGKLNSNRITESTKIGKSEIENHRPSKPVVNLPVNVSTNLDIEASCVSTDADGDKLVYSYAWFRGDNKFLYGNSDSLDSGVIFKTTLDSSYTIQNETLKFVCSVSDGELSAGPTGKFVKINEEIINPQNIAPVMSKTYIDPSKPFTNNDLTGFCKASDADNDKLTYEYQWYLNGVLSIDDSVVDVAQNTLVSFDGFSSSQTSVNDLVKLRCRAYDGEDYSDWKYASTKIVGTTPINHAPSDLTISVPSQVFPNENIVGSCVAKDEDGDKLQYHVHWRLNGVIEFEETSSWFTQGVKYTSTLNSSYTSVNDVWTFECKVTDGDKTAGYAKKDVSVIAIPVEKPTAIIKAPSNVYTDNTFIVRGTDSFAPDGESIVSYSWTVTDENGNLINTYSDAKLYVYFSEVGDYTFTLTVVDTNGESDSTSAIVSVHQNTNVDVGASRDGDALRISSIDLIGLEHEVVLTDDFLSVIVTVENTLDEDLDNVKVTFLLPELGKFSSHARDIGSGDTKTFTFLVDIPYYFDTGVYYPKISALDNSGHRSSKISYFEVIN